MRWSSGFRLAVVMIGAVALGACDVGDLSECGLTGTVIDPDAAVITVDEAEIEPPHIALEGLWWEWAQEVPSFAGSVKDGDAMGVRLTDPADDDAVREVILSWYEEERDLDSFYNRYSEGIRTSIVKYSFIQLHRWRETAVQNLSEHNLGVRVTNLWDIDERENVVRIGVGAEGCIPAFSQMLQDAGIPEDAVVFEDGGADWLRA